MSATEHVMNAPRTEVDGDYDSLDTRPIQGCEELRQLQEYGDLPDGSFATTTITDAPRKVERRYTAPSPPSLNASLNLHGQVIDR